MTPYIPPGGVPSEGKKQTWGDIEKAASVGDSRTDGESMRFALERAEQELALVCAGLLQAHARFSGGRDRASSAKRAWDAVAALEALCEFDLSNR
jgi:hypothetical protein